MTNAEAKNVLWDMGCGMTLTPEWLTGKNVAWDVRLGDRLGWISGRFTPDQLEAIAQWMRDPKGVSEA